MSDRDLVKVHGLPELLRKLEHPVWYHEAARDFLNRYGQRVLRSTISNFTRGKGGWIGPGAKTRKSTAMEVDKSEFPEWVRVGSNKDTFRWGEYGTGLLSEDPKSTRRRHWPPADALQEWAVAHGFPNGFVVARIIGRRGGLAPRRYLRNAVKSTEHDVPKFLGMMARDIEQRASRSA